MGIKILSLFDGMGCGYLAMQSAEVLVDSYDAYEIDEYAVKVASHNFPNIKQHGNVFEADFTQYKGVEFVLGGSPCTYWSIAQKNNRETEASGIGWELFCQYVRAIHEAEPKFFIYENNKSMSKEIRASIDKAFGFEAICINSALVSAQNRQRLYWVGRRNKDGTYSKVNVEQPEDRGILLRDILETGTDLTQNEKSYALTTRCVGAIPEDTLKKHRHTMVAEPVGVGYRNRREEDGKLYRRFETHGEAKANALTTVQTDSMVAEPINVTKEGKARTLRATCYKDGIRNMVGNTVDLKTCVAEPVRIGTIESSIKNTAHDSQQYRVYSPEGKSVTLCGQGGGVGAKTELYATPIRVGAIENGGQGNRIYSIDGKSVSQTATSGGMGSNTGLYAVPTYATATGKPIYEVKNGYITIKGKQYPIKLSDGYYIIRKLTVRECMRLQTVPEWYDFSVISNSQAYKCLGNGWTISVIELLIKACTQNGEDYSD